MEHLQNAELHENINSVTFGDSLESVNQPKPHKKKKYARICLSDLFGQTHTDILLRLWRYSRPYVADPVSDKWLAVPITIPRSTKKKDKEGTA